MGRAECEAHSSVWGLESSPGSAPVLSAPLPHHVTQGNSVLSLSLHGSFRKMATVAVL